jgi:4,5-dihydroxyphthalate decarboxylase
MVQPVAVRALLGDYPVTQALKKGEVKSPSVRLDFADVKTVSSAFKRVVRDLEFDCAELAIVTFLMAKAHGKPLVLLPAVVMSRFQHPHIVYNAERGPLAPSDLAGRRVGMRSYTVTTTTWLRSILANDYGVDLDRVTWVTFEEPHVAEFRDPPSVERAAEAWHKKYGAIQINHMMVVKDSLSKSAPDAVREIYRLLAESKKAARLPRPGELDSTPFGLEANRRNLEVAIDTVYRQKMIPRRLAVEELFDDVTRKLD